jgi:hypothetical protein
MRTHFLLLFACAFLSCGGDDRNTNDPAGESAGTTVAQPAATDLSSHDLPLQIVLPDKSSIQAAETTMGWHEEEGWFGVKAGDHFSLRITEEPGDIARLKRDLESDLVRKHTVITDTPDLVVYRSEFPDDPGLVFVHFYQVIHAGERSFVVESDPEGKFNEAEVERMRAAVSPKTPA